MPEPSNSDLTCFFQRLARRVPLDDDDRAALRGLPYTIKTLRRHEFIVREDDTPQFCGVLLSGFVIRHKIAGNGGRQIFSIHMRGEGVDLYNSLLGRADHNLQMLSLGEIAFIPVDAVHDLIQSRPALTRAMWFESLVESAIFREWTLNVGRRDARSRMSHMLCEFAQRLEEAGLGQSANYELPMTQEELGDALALTPIHVNRTLKLLADEGFLGRAKRSVKILDWHGLAEVGDFNPNYLHLRGT